MAKYKHNKYQKIAFWCWGIGSVIIIIPLILMFIFIEHGNLMGYLAGSMLLGIIVLATGGTFHKIGEGREKQD